MIDPFTLLYNELWALAEGHTGLTDLVKVRNRIKLEKRTFPHKPSVADSDMPELLLIPDGGVFNFNRSSSQAEVVRNFSWIITTGDMRVSERLFPVEWELFISNHLWCSRMMDLTYDGQRFVQSISGNAIVNGEADANNNRGIKGWSAIWSYTVQLTFSKQKLRSYYHGDS